MACLLLGGCVDLMPYTAAAIAPATLEDLGVGLLADLEQWVAWVLLVFGA